MNKTWSLKSGALLLLWCLIAYGQLEFLQIAQNIYVLYSSIIPRYVMWEENRFIVYKLLLLFIVWLIARIAYHKGWYIASIVLVCLSVTACLLVPAESINFE